MLYSRKVDDLATPAKIRVFSFISAAKQQFEPLGIEVLVTCTKRDGEAQNALYAHGRTREQLDAVGLTDVQPVPGSRLTNAHANQSFHQFGVATDILLLKFGKAIDDHTPEGNALWTEAGEIGERCGLEWAGRWKGSLQEKCHFQYTGGLTLADFQAGKTISLERAAA